MARASDKFTKEELKLMREKTLESQKQIALKKEELKYQDEVIKKAEQEKLGMEILQAEAEKINEQLDTTLDLENELAKNMATKTGAQKKQVAVHQQVVDTMQSQVQQGGITEKQLANQVSIMDQIAAGTMSVDDMMGELADKSSEMTPEFEQFLKSQVEFEQAVDASADVMDSLNEATGGVAGGIAEFSKIASSPAAMGAAIIAGMVAALVKFSGQLDAIGDQFGAIGVQQFSTDLMEADAELAKIGMDAGTAATITSELSDNFGVGVKDAIGMSAAVGDMSKALGLSVEEGSQLMGTFMTMGGMSPQQAEDTAKMAAQLANANNVNPSAVLKDIAGSTETFAKFGKDGGANLIEAAVVAKKLGTNLDSVAGTMESMLNFADSTSKAMEASVMIGRDINVQKLQELSLSGDAAGVLEEQKRLLGDQEKWNSMNVLQRKALAEALGLSVEEANKMVNAEKEQATLSGELAKQPGFEQLVGKEALSSLSELMGSLTSIAAVLTNVLGPPLNFIVGIFAEGFNVISSVIDILYEFPALAVVVGGALMLLGGKFLVTAIAGIWSAMAPIFAIPFVGPVLGTIAGLGLVATVYKAISGAESKKVGDLKMPSQNNGGPIVSSPKEGGLFQGTANDDVLMGPGLATAQATTAAAGGAGGGGVVEAINNLNATTKENKPPSAKEQGKRVGRTLEQMGDG